MMTAEQFTYWLQGYAELNASPPTAEQWQAIRDHLALVFNKVTPQRIPGYPNWQPGQHFHSPAVLPSSPYETRTVC